MRDAYSFKKSVKLQSHKNCRLAQNTESPSSSDAPEMRPVISRSVLSAATQKTDT